VNPATSVAAAEPGAGWVLRYLVHRGVLTASDAVHAAPTVEDISVSHRSYRVSLWDTPRWFVKRSDRVRSRGRDLGSEATVYRLASRHPGLAAIVPRCWRIGAQDDLLVLDAVAGAPLSAAPLSGAGDPAAGREILRA
jgi:hypothetical protein